MALQFELPIFLVCVRIKDSCLSKVLTHIQDTGRNCLENSEIAMGVVDSAVYAIAVDSFQGRVAIGVGCEVQVAHKVAKGMLRIQS
jgi:hypothetical protein